MFIHKNKKQKVLWCGFVQTSQRSLQFRQKGHAYAFQTALSLHRTYTQSTQNNKLIQFIILSALFVQNIFLRQKTEFILLKTM